MQLEGYKTWRCLWYMDVKRPVRKLKTYPHSGKEGFMVVTLLDSFWLSTSLTNLLTFKFRDFLKISFNGTKYTIRWFEKFNHIFKSVTVRVCSKICILTWTKLTKTHWTTKIRQSLLYIFVLNSSVIQELAYLACSEHMFKKVIYNKDSIFMRV